MMAVETLALNKRFHRVHAVRDVNLAIEEGSVYALMGPNGAGKTTLIKLLMNLMSPTGGRISVLGAAGFRLEGKGLETVGYVSENQKLPDWMTVSRFLAYCRPFYPTWDAALEQLLVKRFGLPLKRRLKHLSRGIRMKAALTSALAFRPRLIVLDEPLSGLDPLVRDDLMESLRELASSATILLSSHDLAEIESFSTHVGFMDDGRLLLSSSIPDVRSRFRRVTASNNVPLDASATRPPAWLNFESGAAASRWIETDFDAVRSTLWAREYFGPTELSTQPLTLREVFLALARPNHPLIPAEAHP